MTPSLQDIFKLEDSEKFDDAFEAYNTLNNSDRSDYEVWKENRKNEMIPTTPLKIWTLISHAFIIIGLGHGIVTLGIAEFIWLSTIFEDKHSSGGDGHVSLSILQLIAFMCLAGQVAIAISILLRRSSSSKWILFAGHCLLWASVITYAYSIRNDNYAHLAISSCLPLVYCTIKTLFGRHVQLLWQKIDVT